MKKTVTEFGIETGAILKVYHNGKLYDIGNVRLGECELYRKGKFKKTVPIKECKVSPEWDKSLRNTREWSTGFNGLLSEIEITIQIK